jgi:ParB-like chromosome segregation protein Spo0J
MHNPIDEIVWRDAKDLNANYWNPNRVHKQELRLLEHSLLTTGWIQPILINENNLIIDGFHRWRLSCDSKKIAEAFGGKVPTAMLKVDDAMAMAITVRINRAKGTHVAVEMHKLVHALLTQHYWSREQIAKEIGATLQEVDILAQDGVFAAKNIANWAYSQAWYPAENGKNASNNS